MPIFIVKKTETGISTYDFLQKKLPAAPPAYLKQLLNKGKVKGIQGVLHGDELLKVGNRIRLPDSSRLLELLSVPVPLFQSLSILYETREILVVDKPAGLVIHSSQGHEQDNLTLRVAQLLAERGAKYAVAPVHRLDLETSGPVLFGKGKRACSQLGQMFMRQEVEKYYLALVAGKIAGSGRLESQLTAKGKKKQACTDFRALVRNEQASLVELQLQTGRQHQIRRQLAEQGHQLFGDRRYRGPCPPGLPRMFLHCFRLAFIDPFSAAQVAVEAPLPDELAAFLPQVDIRFP
ncbi:RluA family pseudouridine synthase [Malonomonas rubra]|uniref:RluA family pseudouridine synthase n=1 Tax=Malonomonas rubra TaxID=57040 RepID=UPI0026EF69EA|nr:RluA family pseudouridine synthase [Malonomonas rubra]